MAALLGACGGAGCLREGVAGRPWMAGGMGTDGRLLPRARASAAGDAQSASMSPRSAASTGLLARSVQAHGSCRWRTGGPRPPAGMSPALVVPRVRHSG
jgi:hypothetical protein